MMKTKTVLVVIAAVLLASTVHGDNDNDSNNSDSDGGRDDVSSADPQLAQAREQALKLEEHHDAKLQAAESTGSKSTIPPAPPLTQEALDRIQNINGDVFGLKYELWRGPRSKRKTGERPGLLELVRPVELGSLPFKRVTYEHVTTFTALERTRMQSDDLTLNRDKFQEDELEVHVWIDGNRHESFKAKFNKLDGIVPLDAKARTYKWHYNMAVQVYEVDRVKNDYLGLEIVTPTDLLPYIKRDESNHIVSGSQRTELPKEFVQEHSMLFNEDRRFSAFQLHMKTRGYPDRMPKMKRLNMHYLLCVKKEDIVGKDDVVMQVKVDDHEWTTIFRRSMKKGENLNLRGVNILYEKTLRVRLIEKDLGSLKLTDKIKFDADDIIGEKDVTRGNWDAPTKHVFRKDTKLGVVTGSNFEYHLQGVYTQDPDGESLNPSGSVIRDTPVLSDKVNVYAWVLEEIECLDKNDRFTDDTIRLHLTHDLWMEDGKLMHGDTMRGWRLYETLHDMRPGKKRTLNTVPKHFVKSAHIRLIEVDTGSKNDVLGDAIIKASELDQAKVKDRKHGQVLTLDIKGEGAHYRLKVRVVVDITRKPFTCLLLHGAGIRNEQLLPLMRMGNMVNGPRYVFDNRDVLMRRPYCLGDSACMHYWGAELPERIHRETGNHGVCERVYAFFTETYKEVWSNSALQAKYCAVTQMVGADVVFAHSQANMLLAAGIARKLPGCRNVLKRGGKLLEGTSTILADKFIRDHQWQWYGDQGPLKGSRLGEILDGAICNNRKLVGKLESFKIIDYCRDNMMQDGRTYSGHKTYLAFSPRYAQYQDHDSCRTDYQVYGGAGNPQIDCQRHAEFERRLLRRDPNTGNITHCLTHQVTGGVTLRHIESKECSRRQSVWSFPYDGTIRPAQYGSSKSHRRRLCLTGVPTHSFVTLEDCRAADQFQAWFTPERICDGEMKTISLDDASTQDPDKVQIDMERNVIQLRPMAMYPEIRCMAFSDSNGAPSFKPLMSQSAVSCLEVVAQATRTMLGRSRMGQFTSGRGSMCRECKSLSEVASEYTQGSLCGLSPKGGDLATAFGLSVITQAVRMSLPKARAQMKVRQSGLKMSSGLSAMLSQLKSKVKSKFTSLVDKFGKIALWGESHDMLEHQYQRLELLGIDANATDDALDWMAEADWDDKYGTDGMVPFRSCRTAPAKFYSFEPTSRFYKGIMNHQAGTGLFGDLGLKQSQSQFMPVRHAGTSKNEDSDRDEEMRAKAQPVTWMVNMCKDAWLRIQFGGTTTHFGPSNDDTPGDYMKSVAATSDDIDKMMHIVGIKARGQNTKKQHGGDQQHHLQP